MKMKLCSAALRSSVDEP